MGMRKNRKHHFLLHRRLNSSDSRFPTSVPRAQTKGKGAVDHTYSETCVMLTQFVNNPDRKLGQKFRPNPHPSPLRFAR